VAPATGKPIRVPVKHQVKPNRPPPRALAQLEHVEAATLAWIDWFNRHRLLEVNGDLPPTELEHAHYPSNHQSHRGRIVNKLSLRKLRAMQVVSWLRASTARLGIGSGRCIAVAVGWYLRCGLSYGTSGNCRPSVASRLPSTGGCRR